MIQKFKVKNKTYNLTFETMFGDQINQPMRDQKPGILYGLLQVR